MSSDLIIGVMQAADASQSQRAYARLAQLNSGKTGLFSKMLAALGASTERAATGRADAGQDLIAGVMAAADPARKQIAEAKLVGFGGPGSAVANGAPVVGQDFIAGVMAAADPSEMQIAETRLKGLDGTAIAVAGKDAKREAAKKLEGALLAAVVEEIVPKESSSLYGEGTAGNIARQFQVEGLAEAAADAEPLGLASQFYGSGPAVQTGDLMHPQQWPYFGRRTITPYAA